MKEVNTTPGKYQVVRSENGCTVTQTMNNGQRIEDNVPAGESTAVFAFTSRIEVDDDSAVVREVFKLAPQQRLALLGVLGGNGGLPAGFKRVEYLASDGAQYILTDDTFTSESTVKATFWVNTPVSEHYYDAIYYRAYNPKMGIYARMYNSLYSQYGSNQVEISLNKTEFGNINNFYNKKVTIEQRKNEYFINDKLVYTHTPQVFTCEAGAALFGEWWGTYALAKLKGRIYGAEYWEAGKKMRDFIACLDETGTPCMYDLVSKKAFYNSGTGDFTYPTERTTYALRRVLPDWGKLTEHGLRRLYHAPANYTGELYDYAVENGYKPIIEPEKPETGYWSPRWTETEEEIVLEWVETEPPTEEHLTQPIE